MLHPRAFAIVLLAAGLGCRPEEPPTPAPAALARGAITGVVVVPDPWPVEEALLAPVVADLDGDGWLDLVGGEIGACVSNCTSFPPNPVFTHGRVGVWPGGSSGFPAAPTFDFLAPPMYRSVFPVEWVGDTNGDGVGEILLAAPETSHGSINEGKLWLAPGAAGALGAPTWALEGGMEYLFLGDCVQALGDANADGYDDLLVSTGEGGGTRAVAFYGGPAGLPQSPDWVSAALGSSTFTLTAGDIDADGYADAFVGASYLGDGVVYGFRGGPGGLSVAPSWTLTHPDLPGFPISFGAAMRVLPDLDADGYPELAVAAPSYKVGADVLGKVDVFRGGPAGPAAAASWTIVGEEPGDNLGRGLAAGDVNGDGLTDLLMMVERSFYTTGGQEDGAHGALVALGVPGGLSTTGAYVLRGPAGSLCRGNLPGYYKTVQVADLDADGRDDVLLTCSEGRDGFYYVRYGATDTDTDGVTDGFDCAPT